MCVARGIFIALFLRTQVMYVLHAEVITLHFEIVTIGTAKLELTCTIDEDKWGSGGTAPLIRNMALD